MREKERQERFERERLERQRLALECEEKRLEEERLRAEEDRRRREAAAAIEARKAAEEKLFNDVVLKAKVSEDCCHVRAYLGELRKTMGKLETEERAKMQSWLETIETVLEQKERWSHDPFSKVEPVQKELSPSPQQVAVDRFSGVETSSQCNYWSNRGWWNKK